MSSCSASTAAAPAAAGWCSERRYEDVAGRLAEAARSLGFFARLSPAGAHFVRFDASPAALLPPSMDRLLVAANQALDLG